MMLQPVENSWCRNSEKEGGLLHSKKPHPKKPIGQHSPRPLHQLAWSWEPLNGASLNAGSGLQLQPRDMAKIGQVILDGGRWRGTQIVSSDWVRESKPQAGCRVYGLERDTAVVSGPSERRRHCDFLRDVNRRRAYRTPSPVMMRAADRRVRSDLLHRRASCA